MFIIKRVLSMIPLLIAISLMAFVLVRVAPGGPFDRERTPASPAIGRALMAKYHLDEPIWKQYLRYLAGLIQGDFGPSLKYRHHTVNNIIAQGLPVSLTLGRWRSVLRRGGHTAECTALRKGSGTNTPATLALLVVCISPGGGACWAWFSPSSCDGSLSRSGDLRGVVLPTLTLGLYFAGRISRLMREGMLNTLHAEFVTPPRREVKWRCCDTPFRWRCCQWFRIQDRCWRC